MKRLPAVAILAIAAAAATAPLRAQELTAEKLPGGTIRWSWTAVPGAVSYDLVGDTLPPTGVENAACRTSEDADPTDTLFDDPLLPPLGSGEYLLVGADDGGGSPYGASTIAGGSGERMPSDNELAGARFQGEHVARIAAKLAV